MLLTGAPGRSATRSKAQDIQEAALGWPRHITPARLVRIFKVARVELPRI